MPNTVWDDSWNTNNESIDAQHRSLIDIVNDIDIDTNHILKTAEALISYSAVHFADEEAMMVTFDYPATEYAEHKAEHNLLKHTLLDFSFLLAYMTDDVKKFKLQVRVFKNFVTVWFTHHFLLSDKKFAEWLNTKGGADASS